MPTLDSTATLPEVKTVPPVNGKDLKTVLTGKAAPRYDGKNLLITIDVGADEAKFHCQDPEHVGTHKQRRVMFCADKDCWLKFTANSAFAEDYLELKKGKETPAHVSDEVGAARTDCVIRVSAAKTAKAAKMMEAIVEPKRGPVIVVP